MDDKIKLLIQLQKIQEELTNKGIKCWLDYGQLLGAKRSGKLLPWDNDIDFGILYNEKTNIKEICEIVAKHLEVQNDVQNFLTPFRTVVKFKKYNFLIEFYFFIEKDFYYHTPYSAKGGLDMRSFFFDELDEIELEEIKFKCPRHLELYLKIRYGDTWETPIEKSYSFIKTNPGNVYQDKKFHCLITGVFDLLHIGHIKLFERAKKEFDIVTVALCDDELCESYKRKPNDNLEKRYQKIIQSSKVDNVIKGCPLIIEQEYLENYDFVVFGREDNVSQYFPYDIKNHPMSRTPNISSSFLMKYVNL